MGGRQYAKFEKAVKPLIDHRRIETIQLDYYGAIEVRLDGIFTLEQLQVIVAAIEQYKAKVENGG